MAFPSGGCSPSLLGDVNHRLFARLLGGISRVVQIAHLSAGETNKGSIVCPITRKGITSQKMTLIKRYVQQ